jgi:hypothetical protein
MKVIVMPHKLGSFWILLLLASLSDRAMAQCTSLNDSSSAQELISFLRTSKGLPRAKQDSECITFAIRHLEYKPSPEAEELLIGYLEFERPLSQAERTGFAIHGPLTESNTHPAIGTLLTFGKSAVSALISSIGDSNSETFRSTATHTLMLIFRDQPPVGIEYLMQRATNTEPSKSAKLKLAASNAVQWCGKDYKQQCEAALAENH